MLARVREVGVCVRNRQRGRWGGDCCSCLQRSPTRLAPGASGRACSAGRRRARFRAFGVRAGLDGTTPVVNEQVSCRAGRELKGCRRPWRGAAAYQVARSGDSAAALCLPRGARRRREAREMLVA